MGQQFRIGHVLPIFSTLSMPAPPPRSACINAPFLTYTRNHHFFFMVNFYSRTECFHKGSCLGWNEVLILPGQLNEPFREVPALCWALELPPAHGMLLSHVCGFHNPGPSLPAGNCVKES